MNFNDPRFDAVREELARLPVEWRRDSPTPVDWYRPPLPESLPLLWYAVNPADTIILKVAILPPHENDPEEEEEEYAFSVALFRRDGEFMFDTWLGLSAYESLVEKLERIFSGELFVQVREQNGRWNGSELCAVASRDKYTYGLSWLGTCDYGIPTSPARTVRDGSA